MADPRLLATATLRPEFEADILDRGVIGEIIQPLTLWERISSNDTARRIFVLVLLAVTWEVYARYLDEPLMLPTFSASMRALWDSLVNGVLIGRIATSLQILFMGFAIGVVLAAVVTSLAVSTRFGTDVLSMLTSMFNPLPAIALLPLALLWFGLGAPSLIFVIVHSVLWAVALNTHSGFLSTPETLRMVGANCGLKNVRYVVSILIPAAFPSILTGLKIGWAFGWRTLIAAELIFGVSAQSGGLGYFIYENRNRLDTAYVFAGLVTIIIIGLFIESVVFRLIERHTVIRWGMQR